MWVALLRAVNLGGRNRVPMAQLRAVLEAAGHVSVQTVIASGNIVLGSPKPSAAAIERLVEAEFGVTTIAIVRTAAQIRALAAAKPFDEEAYVAFTTAKPGSVDGCVVVGRDLVFPRSAELPGALLEKRLGAPVTVRNWRTVERLAQLVA